LEKACGHAIRKNDVLIINTGWHHEYEDGDYFTHCPGFVPSAGEWMVEKGIKVVGHDTQAKIENVGGDLDSVTGKRCTFAFFPWNWDRGDGCIIRLVAMIDKGQQYRIEAGGRPWAARLWRSIKGRTK